eukprot:403375232
MVQKCQHCNKFYNLTNRKPIIANECACVLCLECIQSLLNDSLARQIQCPGCKENSTLPDELKESEGIMMELQSQDLLTIICDQHQTQTASLYCLKCEIPVCSDCKLDTHNGHQFIDLKKSKFKTYLDNAKEIFEDYSVKNMKSLLDQISHNEVQQTSSQFKSNISKISRMFHYLTSEERYKIDLPSCLGEPQNDLNNVMSDGNVSVKLSQKDIQNMINKSQAELRDEFKQTLKPFDTTSSIKRKLELRIEVLNSAITVQLQQLKNDYKTDLDLRFKEFSSKYEQADQNISESSQNKTEIDQRLQNLDNQYIQLCEQIQEINGNLKIEFQLLTDQLVEFGQKTDQIKHENQRQIDTQASQLLEFSKNLKSLEIKNDNTTKLQVQNDQVFSDCRLQNFRILVDREINQTNDSILKAHLNEVHKNGGISRKFSRLFKGTLHGFTASKFNELCDNKGSTVCFIQSVAGQVFGGYTSVPWKKSESQQLINDTYAFVFSLSKKSIHNQYQNQNYAVRHNKDQMCLFGNTDIIIIDNCDQKNNWCNLGGTYKPYNEDKYGQPQAQSYLAGQYQFQVLEIEVYQVI